MKVMLKSLSGKSLVVDVSPTDTFMDLQARTLQKTGCLLDLHHFKYKGKEIKADNNVMKFLQDGLSENKDKDGPAVSKVAKGLKEPVSASDSVKPTNSDDFIHISHKKLSVKAARKQKSSRKVFKHSKRLISPRNVVKTVDISARKVVINSQVAHISVVHDNENRDSCGMEVAGNLGCIKGSEATEQKMDAKDKLKVEDMDSIYMNDQQKSNDSVYVDYKNIQNVASISNRTSGSKRKPGRDMLQQNSSKQDAHQICGIENFMETDKYKIPTESVDIMTCSRNIDYITDPAKKELYKDAPVGPGNFVQDAASFREESCKDEISSFIGKHKPKQEPENLKLENNNNNHVDSIILCSEKEDEKTCVEGSSVHCMPVRASSEVNLTIPNTLKMLESTNMDKDMLSETTISSVDLMTVTSIRPKTPTSSIMYDSEVQPNTTASSETQLAHPSTDGDSGQPDQLCRLCALPRKTMVYIFSETGLRLGLRSKINTWLPTHVSRTDPLPKQVCEFCIEKLDLCQGFGISCVKAEQTLNQLYENGKFR
ncbi:hypothetical protein L798_03420 [Zootermopsis nevadensis]|uniref:Uncharacterized protein n=2 Tax=Zootermopsis nevadensis TaxID=136037 RepID=A0A067QTM2_ZOONE|nr:hypothetical protein L798_03420 [Zootermopsis nevadensis]